MDRFLKFKICGNAAFSPLLAMLLLLLLFFHNSVVTATSSNASINNDNGSHTNINLYQNLFKVKRKEHLAVVQKLILVEDVAKLASYIKVTMDTIIRTIQKSIVNLQIAGYEIGQEFPKDMSIREELSKILENTAFFTDLMVRFPRPSHIYYKNNKKVWKKTMTEAIHISDRSGVFDGDYQTLLHNLRQELEIGPKDESYKNPFLNYEESQDTLTSEERQELYKAAKRKEKLAKKRSKSKKPKMTAHAEL